MNNTTINPEQLYRQFKQTRRPAQLSRTATAEQSPDPNGELVDQVYRRYQQTRDTAEQDIDEIMQLIHEAVPDKDSDAANNDNAVAAQSDMTQAAADSAAANDENYLARYIVPAIAATLFAFVIFPFFTTKENNQLHPASDIDYLSADVIPFVNPVNSDMLGFSDSKSPQSNAIRHGILTTDLQILVRYEQNPEKLRQVVRSYLLEDLREHEITRLSAHNLVADTLTDANRLSQSAINSTQTLITELRTQASANNSIEWYHIGQATESVILASQLALTTTDTSQLRSAILHGNGLHLPDELPQLRQQLESLFAETIEESMPPADIRRILHKAQDIKSVVQ